MPPAPFYPPADAGTYRDLFSSKNGPGRTPRSSNAPKNVIKRCFLAFQIFVIVPLASEVLLDLNFIKFMLVRPTRSFLRDFLPTFPYLEVVGLFVAVMTLVLFIPTGTYTEKISYTNIYVLHINRSLRSFNIAYMPPPHTTS